MKKAKIKRILSLGLAVIILSSVPISVSAATQADTSMLTTSTTCVDGKDTTGDIGYWFDSLSELESYYKSVVQEWNNKYTTGKINILQYIVFCPQGYEAWSCSTCGMWTGNYKYDQTSTVDPATCEHNWTYMSFSTDTHAKFCTICYAHAYENCSYSITETLDVTCTKDGYRVYECSYCEATVTENISATGHDWMYTEYTDDLHIKGCSYCHASDIEEHNFTYESLGDETHKVTCSACTYEETEACSATDGSICDYCGGTISTDSVEEPTTEPSTDKEEPDETTTSPSEPDTEPSTEPDEGETEVTEPSTTPEEETSEPSTDEEENTTVTPEEDTTTAPEESTTGSASEEETTVAEESTTATVAEETTVSADASTTSSSDTETSSKVTDADIPDTGAYESTFVCFALAAACTLALLAVAFIRAKKKSARNSR